MVDGRSRRIVLFQKGAFARNIERGANDRGSSNNRDQAGATVYAATTFYWTERPRQRHIRFQSVPQHTSRRTTTRQSVDEILRLVVKTAATLNDHARIQDQNFALEFRFYQPDTNFRYITRSLFIFEMNVSRCLLLQREWRFQNRDQLLAYYLFFNKKRMELHGDQISKMDSVSYSTLLADHETSNKIFNIISTLLPRESSTLSIVSSDQLLTIIRHIKFKRISFR